MTQSEKLLIEIAKYEAENGNTVKCRTLFAQAVEISKNNGVGLEITGKVQSITPLQFIDLQREYSGKSQNIDNLFTSTLFSIADMQPVNDSSFLKAIGCVNTPNVNTLFNTYAKSISISIENIEPQKETKPKNNAEYLAKKKAKSAKQRHRKLNDKSYF